MVSSNIYKQSSYFHPPHVGSGRVLLTWRRPTPCSWSLLSTSTSGISPSPETMVSCLSPPVGGSTVLTATILQMYYGQSDLTLIMFSFTMFVFQLCTGGLQFPVLAGPGSSDTWSEFVSPAPRTGADPALSRPRCSPLILSDCCSDQQPAICDQKFLSNHFLSSGVQLECDKHHKTLIQPQRVFKARYEMKKVIFVTNSTLGCFKLKVP